MSKYNKSVEKIINVDVPMLKCDFCGKETENQNCFGLTRTWGDIKAVTPCGCNNNWIICPDCIRVRLQEIHEFHFKNKS